MDVGRGLVLVGLVCLAGGGLVMLWRALGLPLPGRLPGDIVHRGGRWTLYAPLGTCLVVSLLATLLFALLRRP